MPDKIVLGGRAFAPMAAHTVKHDAWMMGHVRRAELDEVVVRAGESAEEFGRRFLGEVMASGKACLLLGGLMVPEEVGQAGWTPEVAEETARHVEGLTAAEDKAAVWSLVASMLIAFFESGLASLYRSAASSSEGGEDQPDSVAAAILAGGSGSGRA